MESTPGRKKKKRRWSEKERGRMGAVLYQEGRKKEHLFDGLQSPPVPHTHSVRCWDGMILRSFRSPWVI